MNRILFALICCLPFVALTGCNVDNQRVVADESTLRQPVVATATPIKNELSVGGKTGELCKRLNEIKKLPDRDPNDTDPLYEAIVARGNEAVPCLIDEITNEAQMPDPREAPSWKHYKVGDTAVFVLVDIAKNDELLEEMLPLKYRNEWKTNGIYAYFNYVSESRNRQQLQQWWRTWMKKNIDK